jgi:phosphatidylglycerophosphate synthase
VSERAGWDRYAARWAALHGGYDPRQAPGPVRVWLRLAYRSAVRLGAAGVGPTAVTAAGVAVAAAVPLVAAWGAGWPVFAALLVVLGAVADTVDGALAVITDRVTRLGRVYDPVADRLTEAAWLVAVWLLGGPGWLVTLCGALSWLHEYLRARATVAGLRGIGVVTVGERPTRVLLASFGLALTGVAGLIDPGLAAGTATVTAVVWALLGGVGLAQLAAAVRRSLSAILDD